MAYKLKDNGNGEVNFIAQAGSDFVKASMPVGKAQGIIASGKYEKSDKFDGFEIKTGKYYFAGTVESEVKEEKPAEPKKPE